MFCWWEYGDSWNRTCKACDIQCHITYIEDSSCDVEWDHEENAVVVDSESNLNMLPKQKPCIAVKSEG